MRRGFGQYCPLSLAAELLCERWTILVLHRVLDGCARFNEIHRGVPRISATLLSQRLVQLEEAGLITREVQANTHPIYLPTDAGRELLPIIFEMAVWGHRWGRDMVDDDMDPAYLAWDMSRRLNSESMPPGRTVISFLFDGTHSSLRRFWLVHEDGVGDMCLKDPGWEVDLHVEADLRRLVEAWRGFRSLKREIAAGAIRLQGPAPLRRAFPSWLLLHPLAGQARLVRGAVADAAGAQGRGG